MSDPVRRCPAHGYSDGACHCGTVGETVLPADRRTQLSKFLSGALRHFPDDAGLSLDDQGWTAWPAVVEAVSERYPWADSDAVAAVVATDPKGRFERDDGRVRAAYGHSVDVDLDPTDDPVPDRLYHGTSPSAADSIREEGLKPMGRQQVHLSATREDARAVGRRHASDPVVFAVDAAALAEEFRIAKRGEGTYTVDRVPPAFLTVVED
ncbi:putative RNA 2'-phosphotransferase [Haloplanus vescus]|uniref:Probable RNA 2'-phosphotransferase n=1 Tax=Haloplanus vescus TaxID=555874 RepID=A0A1H3VVN7_9EURY|nr:RNA 2'-phosphotransferase [Haloplanus vescus]SDZ78264.1 putative RNA 2'-phosphotransferase [Haloplanus vescus]